MKTMLCGLIISIISSSLYSPALPRKEILDGTWNFPEPLEVK
jgi:hypothetical protein